MAATAMRTEDMSEMEDGWNRMRGVSMVLLTAGIALGLSAVGALAISTDTRTRFGVTVGEAVFLIAVASMRVFMAVGTGSLRRRRAFDPDRVRDAPSAGVAWPYWLVVAALALGAASLVTGWLGFLDGRTHGAAKTNAYALWPAISLAGFAVAAFTFARSKDGALRASTWAAAIAGRVVATAADAGGRFLLAPLARIVDRTGQWVPAGDGAIGRVSLVSGRAAASVLRAPALPALIVMAVLLAFLVALLSPGVLR
jgi:hypothetical protein